MDRQQIGLLTGMSVTFLLVIGVAAYFGNLTSSGGNRAHAVQMPEKRFAAKPGTQRDNARVLYTSRDKAPEDVRRNPGEPPQRIWGTLDRNDTSDRNIERDESLESLSPEEALAITENDLLNDNSELSECERYSSYAFALARQTPIDDEQIKRVLERAEGMVGDDAEREIFLYFQCKTYLELDDFSALSTGLSSESLEWLRPGPRAMAIGLMRAYASEELGHTDDAEAAYRWVLEAAEVWELLNDPRCEGIYRQANLRLCRLYEDSGRMAEATATQREMRFALAF